MDATLIIGKTKERLAALSSYNVLDSLNEEDYDNITKLAAAICKTPISLISLVDSDRQWFKSNHGLTVRETPIEYSFCARAIEDPENKFIVPDATEDNRFKDNPLVTEDPKIVFYAGIPLVNSDGIALGTLCVIDRETRELKPEQIEALETLARQTLNLLELRRKKILLERALEDTKQHHEALDQFALRAAHDIKSPLSNIITLTNLLMNEGSIEGNKKVVDLLELVKSSSNQLFNYINGLLEFNRSQSLESAHTEVFSVYDVWHHLKSFFRDKEAKIELHVENETHFITTVRIAVEQVLLNLVSNAIKYCDKETPKVDIFYWDKPDHYVFHVKDNGPGFPENRDKLFSIFETGTNQDRYGEKGNGIGLATVKRVVNILGGEVEILKSSDKGSTVSFTIAKLDKV